MQRNGVNKEILYINWWPTEKRDWFNDFLDRHNLLVPGKRFQLVFMSVMGRRWITTLPFWRPKVFFTAEDTTDRYIDYDDYLVDTVDLSLGFKQENLTKNRLNLPLWFLYNIAPSNVTSRQTGDQKIPIEDVQFPTSF